MTTAYRQALAHTEGKPEEQFIHSNLAEATLRAGQLDIAERHFQRAADLDPKDPEPWAGLASVRERQGRGAEAAANLRSALERLPSIEDAKRREEMRRDLDARLEKLGAGGVKPR